MRQPSSDDLRRWSDEVARNPDTLAFIPLAEAYRRQGRQNDALRICLRGLERHPSNVEAHAVLARIYLARSDKEKAFDEWLLISKLDPEHFETRRGLGFGYLERGNLEEAVRHLTKAAELRPHDETVREALALARRQLAAAGAVPGAGAERGDRAGAPGAETRGTDGDAGAGLEATAPEQAFRDAEDRAVSAPAAAAGGFSALQPEALFAPLMESPVLRGVVLLDADGLLLAGSMRDSGAAGAEAVASVLSGAMDEAARAVAHLDLGRWQGILLETEDAKSYLVAVEDGLLLVAGEARAPVGWLKRVAGEAREIARAFLRRGGA